MYYLQAISYVGKFVENLQCKPGENDENQLLQRVATAIQLVNTLLG